MFLLNRASPHGPPTRQVRFVSKPEFQTETRLGLMAERGGFEPPVGVLAPTTV